MKKLVVYLLFLLSSVVFAEFPYYVAPEILEEVKVNEARYEKYPTDNGVLFDLAMSYAYSGQILDGWLTLKKLPKSYAPVVISKYEQLIEESPAMWQYHFKCAFGYFFQGRKQDAIDSFHKVIAIDDQQVWAYGFIALVYGEMGNVDDAISYCKKGLEIEPNATGIHFLLGEGYRKKKKYMKFLKQMLKVGKLQAK